MKTFHRPHSLQKVFEPLMRIANKPSIRHVYVSLLIMLMFAAFVQVHNIRNIRSSSDANPTQDQSSVITQEPQKEGKASSVLEQFAGVLAIPSLVLKTVNQFNGNR